MSFSFVASESITYVTIVILIFYFLFFLCDKANKKSQIYNNT